MKKKFFLLIAFTGLANLLMAQVSVIDETTSTSNSFSYTAVAGSNRLLLVNVGAEFDNPDGISSITYGGQTLTEVNSATISNIVDNLAAMYYLDESGIAGRSGNTLTVTYNTGGGNIRGEVVGVILLDNVDQTTPVFDSETNTADATSIASPSAISAFTNDMIVAIADGQFTNREFTPTGGFTELHETIGSSNEYSSATLSVGTDGDFTPGFNTSGADMEMAFVAARINHINTSGPGGETDGLTLWFGADMDITTSGSTVTNWSNQVNGNLAALTNAGNPSLATNGINFNPEVQFDGNDVVRSLETGGFDGSFVLDDDENTLFIIQEYQSGPVTFKIETELNGNLNRFGLEGSSNTQRMDFPSDAAANLSISTGTINDSYHLIAGVTGASSSSLFLEGLQDGTSTSSGTISFTDNLRFSLGGDYLQANTSTVDIAEVIVYKKALSATERLQVESYLAMKYGITLGNTTNTLNYKASDGTDVWTGDATYQNDIGVIGRDDNGGLDQRQTQSISNDAVLTIGNTDIATTNQLNGNSFGADLSFFAWGTNNQPAEGTGVHDHGMTLNGEDIEKRVARVWKAVETGTVGTLKLRFDLSATTGVGGTPGNNDLTHVRLLVDTDGTFASGATSISPTSFDNATDIVEFDHNFAAGTGFYFSIGTADADLAPLPIELLSFDATVEQNKVDLDWTTVTEINNDFFTVQRSSDAKQWEEIGNVKGAGNSSDLKNYSHRDNNPLSGISFYRIKQTDFNGDSSYSPVRRVEIASDFQDIIHVYPNPASTVVNIAFSGHGNYNDNIEATVTNMLGQSLEMQSFEPAAAITLDVANYPPGAYIVTLKAGGQLTQHKITIK